MLRWPSRSPRTNGRKRPAVQRAVYALQQELIDTSESRGLALMPDAIATLTAIMNDENARASDRIAAIRAAADQTVPREEWPDQSIGFADWNLATERCEQRKKIRANLLAIAAELEGQ